MTYGIRVYGSGTSEFNSEIDTLNAQDNTGRINNNNAKTELTELYTQNYLVLGKNIVEYNARIWFNFESTVRLNDILTLSIIVKMVSSEYEMGTLIETDPNQTCTVIATTSQITVNNVNISGNWAVIAWTGGSSHPSGSGPLNTANTNYLDEIKYVRRFALFFTGNYNYVFDSSPGSGQGTPYIFSMYHYSGTGSTSFNTYTKTTYKVIVVENNYIPGKVLGTVANSVITPYVHDWNSVYLPGKTTYNLAWSGNDFYLSNTSIGNLDQYDYLHASLDGAWLYNMGSTSDVAQLGNSVYSNGILYGAAVSTYVGNYVTYDNMGIRFQTAPGTNITAGTEYYIRDSTHEYIMCSTTNNYFWALKYKISLTSGGTPIVLQGYRTSTSRVTTYTHSFYSIYYYPNYQTRTYRRLNTTYITKTKLSLNQAFFFLAHNDLYGGYPALSSNPPKDANYPSALKKAVSTRPQIISAFLDNTSANLIPTETEITYWKSRDLGTSNNIFNSEITTYNQNNYSQYTSNSALRTAWTNIQCPFTESQIANLNGSPSQAIATGYTMLLLNSNDTNNKIQDTSNYQTPTGFSGTLPVSSQTDLTYMGTMQLSSSSYYSATSTSVLTGLATTYNFTIEFMVKPTNNSVTGTIIKAPSYSILCGNGWIYFTNGVDPAVQAYGISNNQWNHVAIVAIPFNNSQYIEIYINGTKAVSSTIVTTPNLSFGYIQFGGPVSGWNTFIGYLAQVRVVWGISVYNNTSSFTVSTSKPLWSRVSAVNSLVNLPAAPIIKAYLNYFSNKPKSTIEYWMQRGGDKTLSTIYDTTDVTWNLIDRFTIPAGYTITKSYPQFSTREFQVTQLVVGDYINTGTSGLNSAPLINTIAKSNDYSFQFSGSNVVTSIIVFVR